MVKTYNCSSAVTCIFGDAATVINKDCGVLIYLNIFLLCLSWVQPWDIWQQCAARGGEIWLQLTGMICPWAGIWRQNFWKMSNPHPIPCLPLPRRLNIDRCIIYKFPSSVHSSHYTPGFDMCPCSLTFGNDNRCVVVVVIIIFFFYLNCCFLSHQRFLRKISNFWRVGGAASPPPPPPTPRPVRLWSWLSSLHDAVSVFCCFVFFGPVSCEMGHSTDDGAK